MPWATPRSARPSRATSRCSSNPASTRSSCMAAGRRSAPCSPRWASSRKFEGGLRVTDQKTVEIVEMVLAGSINKEIVALINAEGEWAIGLCGKDGNMVFAEKAAQDGEGSRLQHRARARPGLCRRAGRSRPHAARPPGALGDDPGHRAGRTRPRRPYLQHQRRHLCGRHRRRAERHAPAVPDRCAGRARQGQEADRRAFGVARPRR